MSARTANGLFLGVGLLFALMNTVRCPAAQSPPGRRPDSTPAGNRRQHDSRHWAPV